MELAQKNNRYTGILYMMFAAFSAYTLVVIVVVLIHYESLSVFSQYIPQIPTRPRVKAVIVVLGIILAHLIEVIVFAVAFHLLVLSGDFGSLRGEYYGAFSDAVYFSMTSFTTMGYGDIVATGELRLLAGVEGVTGLVLITWSASFTYIEMQRFWRNSVVT
jgi:hypothetical protein